MKEMKTIKFGQNSDTYEVVDAQARTDIANIPSTYATKTELSSGLGGKQSTLVSGVNIKTINNKSILGSGNITIEGGGAGGGTSEMTVITPTEIINTPLNWSGILEKAFGTNGFYGITFDANESVSNLVVGGTGSWTMSNADMSLVVNADNDSVTLTIGNTTEELWATGKGGGWYNKTIQDPSISTFAICDSGNINFYTEDENHIQKSVPVIFNTTTAASIKKIAGSVHLGFREGSFGTVDAVLSNSGLKYKAATFDATYENNLINSQSYTLGDFEAGGLSLSDTEGTCLYANNQSSFYTSGAWINSEVLWNMCVWDVDTHTVTFPKAIKLTINQMSDITSVPDAITFNVQEGGDIILPDPAEYTDQLAEINDTTSDVRLIIYSTGTEWKFASDVIQLTRDLYNEAQIFKTIYGIPVGSKFYLNPDDGLPVQMSEWGSWHTKYNFQRAHDNFTLKDSYLSLSPFCIVNHVVNAENQNTTIAFNAIDNLFDCVLNVDVGDTVPNYTFSTDTQMLYKQDGKDVQSLTFAANTVYNITFTTAYFKYWDQNQQMEVGTKYILVDCKSFPKTVGE